MAKQILKRLAFPALIGAAALFSASAFAHAPATAEGIIPHEPCDGAEGSYHTNPDGSQGGFVADTAYAGHRAYIGPNAEVCEFAQVYEFAEIKEKAVVSGNVQVYGAAWVGGNARLSGDLQVYGEAWILRDSEGDARIFQISTGRVLIEGKRQTERWKREGNVLIEGKRQTERCKREGNVLIEGKKEIERQRERKNSP